MKIIVLPLQYKSHKILYSHLVDQVYIGDVAIEPVSMGDLLRPGIPLLDLGQPDEPEEFDDEGDIQDGAD